MSEDQDVVQVEKEARLMGWVEKESYRDGDNWVDAETFVKRGKEINPILRKNNENLMKKLNERDAEIAEVKKIAKEFEKFQKDNAERKVHTLEAELKTLKEKKKEAYTNNDGSLVVEIEDQIDSVKEQQIAAKEAVKDVPKEATPAPVVLDPLVTDWMEDNKWFTSDDKYTRIADAIGVSINQNFPQLRGKAFFEKLDEELAEVLPAKYSKQQRTSPVEGSQGTNRPVGSRTKQSYENLPAEAKQACDRYVKTIPGYTKEKYLADFDWS